VPRVGALRSLVARVRANPWLAVGIVAAALLVLAWLGWAIYVASDRGVNEGLGVLIAWPAIVLAVALVSLPFIGGYLLIKRLSSDGGEESGESSQEEPEDQAEEEESEPEPETAAS
jgi:ABC-type sulfate transport system permease subunit